MSIRLRMSNTTGNSTLAQHDIVSDAEVAAAGPDIVAAWGGATQQEAAANAMRFMVKAFRNETVARLKNRDAAAALAAYHTTEDAAEATYSGRFRDMP